MKKTKKILLCVAALSLAFFTGCAQLRAMIPPRDLNPLPNFTVTTLDEQTIARDDLLGTPTMIVFWNSWCPNCTLMMPDVQAIYEEFGDRVRIMAVNAREEQRNANSREEALDNALTYLQENGFRFPLYFDWNLEAYNAMQAPAVPLTVFIDADGYATRWRLGVRSENQLRRDIQEIL